jgi:hypothetical protein
MNEVSRKSANFGKQAMNEDVAQILQGVQYPPFELINDVLSQ